MFGEIINTIQEASGGVNIYNYRIFGSYDFSNIITYLNDTAT